MQFAHLQAVVLSFSIFAISASTLAATSLSDTWESRYECDVAPTQDGWVAKSAGADNYTSAANGVLTVNSLGSNQFPHWLKEVNIDVARGATVEWRMRIKKTEPGDITAAAVLGIRSGAGSAMNEMVAMSVGEMKLHCQGTDLKTDAADRFHVYRMTLDLNGYKLYVDNKPTPVASGPLTPADGSNMDRGIQFGDHTADADAAYEIDFIRWTNSGAFIPDASSALAETSGSSAQAFDDAGMKSLAAEGNLIFSVPQTKRSPTTDGVVTDGEYAFAGAGFIDVVSGQYASQQSRYYVSHDDRALYVAVQSPVTGALQSKVTRRDDSTVCMDDAAEIFIVTGSDVSPIYQVIVNSVGTIFDQKDSDAAWNIKHARFRNKVDGDTWTMEAVIPFSDLGVEAPKPGDIWRLNVCRTFAGNNPLFTSMSPTRHSYLSPRRFGYMHFKQEGPSIAMKSIGDLLDRKLDLDFSMNDASSSRGPVDVKIGLTQDDESTTLLEQQFADSSAINIPLKKDDLADAGALSIVSASPQAGMIYAGTFPFAVSKEKFRQNFIITDLEAKRLRVGVHVPPRYLTGGNLKGTLTLSQGEAVVAQQSFDATEQDAEAVIDITQLPTGDYQTKVTFDLPSTAEPVTLTDTYHRYADGPSPWDGSDAGVTDVVPAPWTDVTVSGDAVGVWDRTYDFADNLLPVRITSRNRQVLIAPMSISASVGGEVWPLTGVQSRWTKQSASSTERHATGNLGELKVSTQVQVDFDGFTWIKCTLESEKPITLDNLHIDIPLDKKYVTLRNLGDYRMERTGAMPAGSFEKDLREKPIFWLGDESGGLQWVAESLVGWNSADWSRSLQVINDAGADRVIARLNVIDAPVKLDGKREIAFGFVATPVKPVRKDFRSFRNAPSGSSAPYNWYIWFTEWTRWVNYPDPSKTVAERLELLKAFHKNGIRVTPYMTLGITTPFSPEFKFYGDDWLIKPAKLVRPLDNPFDPQWDIWANYLVCNNSRSYRDFFAQKMDVMLSQMETDGIYFDFGTSRMCGNELHGCGWVDNTGQKQRSYNVLGTREMARRAYVIIHKHATKDPWIIHHMSGEVDMATNAFCDIMLTGENMTGALMTNENYYKALPLDKFRGEFMGSPFGPLVMDLPQFERAMHVASPDRVKFYSTPEGQKPLEHLIGMTVVHDSLIWPSEGIKPDRMWQVQDQFGWDDQVEFFPYWSNAGYITFTEPVPTDVVVSIFRRGDKLMVVPFNNTDEPVTIKAKIDLEALGFAGAKTEIKDMYFDRTFSQQDGQVEIPVDPRSFRMIFLTR